MSTTICKVCGCKILDTPVVNCSKCETPHHTDCWEYNTGCSVFACNPATKAVIIPKDGPQRPGRWANSAPWFLVFILFGAIGSSLWQQRPCKPQPVRIQTVQTFPLTITEGPTVGCRAPNFTALDLKQRTTTLNQVRRGRVTVLTFWLANCPDCTPFLPEWAKIYERLKPCKDLALVNVAAFTSPTDAGDIQRYCERNHIGGDVLLDVTRRAVPTYKLHTITALVIDQHGVIRYRGSQADASADRLEPVVRRLLKETPPDDVITCGTR
jgi:peroxiredoxin